MTPEKHPGYSLGEREIVYSPDMRDFAMYYEGELVGYARTYQDAEVTLDALHAELEAERLRLASDAPAGVSGGRRLFGGDGQ